MKNYWLSIPLVLAVETAAQAFTLPEYGRTLPVAPEFAPAAAADYDFEGIVALSNCSGSLIRFDDSQDSDPAMVLSNGHCTGMIEPGKVILNQASSRSFDLFNSQVRKVGSLHASQLLYATMTKSDMSLYQVKESYQDIRRLYQIDALTLSREMPAVADRIEVLSGYWKLGYACQVEKIVDTLREGEWSFRSSIRYSSIGCNTKGGTSGSPVIAAGTRMVVAVNNTGNDAGKKCEVSTPCEVNADGSIVYAKGYSYAQQTFWLYSCRNDQGALDFKAAGCLLPKPASAAEIKASNRS